jgi:hypothetical protein
MFVHPVLTIRTTAVENNFFNTISWKLVTCTPEILRIEKERKKAKAHDRSQSMTNGNVEPIQ